MDVLSSDSAAKDQNTCSVNANAKWIHALTDEKLALDGTDIQYLIPFLFLILSFAHNGDDCVRDHFMLNTPCQKSVWPVH